MSILEQVDKHIKEQKIDFKGISISVRVLPYYMRQTLLHYVRRCSHRHFDEGSSIFVLEYDDAGTLYLATTDLMGKTKIVISSGRGRLKLSEPIFRFVEDKLLIDARILKYHRHWIDMANNYYHKGNFKKNELAKIAFDINEQIIRDGELEMLNNPNFNINRIYYKDKVKKSISIINDYIDYCYLYNYDIDMIKNKTKRKTIV